MTGHPLVVLSEGTWGGAWAQPGSAFRDELTRRGFRIFPRTKFWPLDVDGVINPLASRRHSGWRFGGELVAEQLLALKTRRQVDEVIAIAHSHAGQVMAYAATQPEVDEQLEAGRPLIDKLVTVGTPPRDDIDPLWSRAMAANRIGWWLHVHDAGRQLAWWNDLWYRLGQFGDGRFGWAADQRYADACLGIPGIGHTKLLEQPAIKHMQPHVERILAEVRKPLAELRVGPRRQLLEQREACDV